MIQTMIAIILAPVALLSVVFTVALVMGLIEAIKKGGGRK